MFPYQQWRVECAPNEPDDAEGGDGGARRAESDGGEGEEEETAAWLEGLVAAEGEGGEGAGVEALLPHEVLGLGEFASGDEARRVAAM